MLADDYFTIGGSNPYAKKNDRVSLLPPTVNYHSIGMLTPYTTYNLSILTLNSITVEEKFRQGWKHPEKELPPIHGIFTIQSSHDMVDSYASYRLVWLASCIHVPYSFRSPLQQKQSRFLHDSQEERVLRQRAAPIPRHQPMLSARRGCTKQPTMRGSRMQLVPHHPRLFRCWQVWHQKQIPEIWHWHLHHNMFVE
jgi:hypothetical protein